jgi:hypothetical protein
MPCAKGHFSLPHSVPSHISVNRPLASASDLTHVDPGSLTLQKTAVVPLSLQGNSSFHSAVAAAHWATSDFQETIFKYLK